MRGHWRNKVRWIMGAAALVVALALLTPTAVRRFVRWRLAAMVAAELNAELQIEDLSYDYPYGVNVKNATLVAKGPDGQPLDLLRLPHFSLKLARSPLHSGPLVIESIAINNPSIHLIRLREGLVGRRGLARTDSEDSARKPWKLSEMFHLSRLDVNGGQIVYEDRSLKNTRPLVWKNLNIHLNTSQQTGSQYGFHFIADDSPLATLDAAGTADIDALVLKLDACGLTVNVDPALQHSAIPPEYQQALDRLGVRGQLAVNAVATFPLNDLPHSTYDTSLQLRSAMARLPQWKTSLEHLSTTLRCGDGSGKPWVKLSGLDVLTDSGAFHLNGGSVEVDPTARTWKLDNLSGQVDAAPNAPGQTRGSLEFCVTASGPAEFKGPADLSADLHLLPHGLSLQPPGTAAPVEQFAEMQLSLHDGVLTAQRLRAAFGKDLWFIKSLQVNLKQLPRQVIVDNAEGCITFGAPRTKYPPVVEKILANLEPGGPFFFKGTATVGLARELSTTYDVKLHTDRGRFALTDHKIPVYNVRTDAEITPTTVRIDRLTAGTLGGWVQAEGTIFLPGDTRYDVNGTLRGIDLRQLVKSISDPTKKPTPLFGHANMVLHASGMIPGDDRPFLNFVTGSGEVEVKDGDFWRIPVMQGIADKSNVQTAMTVGQAAATFTVSDGAVHLRHAAVSAPALGVEGKGDVGFDGRMKLNCITTVLGNWAEKFDVGDDGTFSRWVNQVQQTLNNVTQAAVMNIRVGGTIDNPDLQAVPAPFLEEPTKNFVRFLKGSNQDGGLLGFVKDDPPQTASKPR